MIIKCLPLPCLSVSSAGEEICTEPNQLWLLDHICTCKYEQAICGTLIDVSCMLITVLEHGPV